MSDDKCVRCSGHGWVLQRRKGGGMETVACPKCGGSGRA